MGQGESSDKGNVQKPEDEKLQAPPDFKGPTERRHCTDILFLVAIIAMWVCMTGVGMDAINNGNVFVLTNGIDYQGRICGYDTEVANKSAMYYVGYSGSGVCVDECPTVTDTSQTYACFDSADIPTIYVTDNSKVIAGYCQWQYASTDILNRCIFDNSTIVSQITDTTQWGYFEEFLADVWASRNFVFGLGLGGTVLLSMVYLILLRLPGVVVMMVWGSILVVFVLLIALGAGMYYQALQWSSDSTTQHSSNEIMALKVVGIILWVLAVVFVCVMCCLRDRIRVAIGIIKESAHCMMDMPLLMAFPVFKLVGFLLFLLPWTAYLLYTASLGTFSTYTTSDGLSIKSFSYDTDIKYRGWFLLFCLFWTTQFIIAAGQIAIAMAVGTWYFSRDKSNIGNLTVVSSTSKTLFYHCGTAAFGSLIIAIVQLIRSILSYIQKKVSRAQNKLVDCILCCMQCCLWCFEKCLKFLNKNAYIQTALFSYKFCKAAMESFNLILRNIARVAAVSIIETFILFIAKAFLAVCTTVIAYFLLEKYMGSELTSLMYPTATVFVLASIVAAMFTEVLGMVISTMLQCFVADEEMFEDNPFATASLKAYIDEHHSHGTEPLKHNA